MKALKVNLNERRYTGARLGCKKIKTSMMTNREELIQELEQAPDDIVQTVLDFLHRVKMTRTTHPLAKFAGILSDAEAEELKQSIATECRRVDLNEW